MIHEGLQGVDVMIHTAVFFVRTPCSLAEVSFGKNILPLPQRQMQDVATYHTVQCHNHAARYRTALYVASVH
jgi:hypothetical protein